MKKTLTTTALSSAFIIASTMNAYASLPGDDINPNDLLNLSLEQLSNIEVTSVSRRSEKASEAAAALYVITQDDIRHSGMTNIPELLRMVPGLDVAQSGAHQWAISSRGSNGQFSNKLLVLIDGRTVYTPLFSGVYWDMQDTPLQDIERIEVIRGPGATLWGANAVNGVINIITKNSKDTLGGFASETMGNQINTISTARYGAKLSEDATMRVYAKYDSYDEFRNMQGNGAKDPWDKQQAGFRADMKNDSGQSATLQGDIYHATTSGIQNWLQPNASTSPVAINENDMGGNILGRYNKKFSAESDLTLQAYYDDARRDNIVFTQNIQTFDLDMQHTFSPMDRNEVVWGAGYRRVESDIYGNQNTGLGVPYVEFSPTSRSHDLYSAFVQDKISLIPDNLFLTLGSKLEKNDFTGVEYQPSARLSWLVDSKQTLWTSVSRAVKTPSVGISDSQIIVAPANASPLAVYAQTGSQGVQSEELVAYEVGYRIQPTINSSIDVSVFYNDYSKLVLGSPGAAQGPLFSPLSFAYFVVPISPVNAGSAHSYGSEVSAKWNPTTWLDLASGYSLEQLKFDQSDPFGYSFNGKSPQQQFNARATVRLPYNLEWNSAAYYVDSLTAIDPNTGAGIPSYTRIDTGLTWHAMDNMDVSLVGQNLFDSQHQEFSGFLYQNSSQVPRTIYGNVSVKF